MAISKEQLKNLIRGAYDGESDNEVDPSEARERIAEKLADAIEAFVTDRDVRVVGVQPGSATIIGKTL